MNFLKYDQEPVKCECSECGKQFNRGDEGDNETVCLRCEHLSSISDEEWE